MGIYLATLFPLYTRLIKDVILMTETGILLITIHVALLSFCTHEE
jgi:hypothetical protein